MYGERSTLAFLLVHHYDHGSLWEVLILYKSYTACPPTTVVNLMNNTSDMQGIVGRAFAKHVMTEEERACTNSVL